MTSHQPMPTSTAFIVSTERRRQSRRAAAKRSHADRLFDIAAWSISALIIALTAAYVLWS